MQILFQGPGFYLDTDTNQHCDTEKVIYLLVHRFFTEKMINNSRDHISGKYFLFVKFFNFTHK